MTTRRDFLKTGLAGGLLLNVAACARPSENGGRTQVLNALIPVMLAGALSPQPEAAIRQINRTLSGVETAINGLSLATQKEIDELFDLLAFPPHPDAGGWPLVTLGRGNAVIPECLSRQLATQPF
jgi:hypothetical protein